MVDATTGTPGDVAYTTISPFDGSEIFWFEEDPAADFEVDLAVRGDRPKEFALKSRPGELKTLDEWATALGAARRKLSGPGRPPSLPAQICGGAKYAQQHTGGKSRSGVGSPAGA